VSTEQSGFSGGSGVLWVFFLYEVFFLLYKTLPWPGAGMGVFWLVGAGQARET
jgi:hypothetical protein